MSGSQKETGILEVQEITNRMEGEGSTGGGDENHAARTGRKI